MRGKLPIKQIQAVDPRIGKTGVRIYCESQRLSLSYLKSRVPVIDVSSAQRLTVGETKSWLSICAAFVDWDT
eukprot:2491935-Lingulodinium_polyedra.AAC.1